MAMRYIDTSIRKCSPYIWDGDGCLGDLKNFIENVFLADVRGQIFAMNALRGVEIGLHTPILIKELMAEAYSRSLIKHPTGCDCEQFLRLIEDASIEADPYGATATGKALSGCGAKCDGDLCVVLPAPAIAVWCTKEDSDRFQNATLLVPTTAPLDWLYALPPSERYFSLKKGAAIGSTWIWFTHETGIAPPDPATLSKFYTASDYYRDVLGLIHREAAPTGASDNHLVLLKLPVSVASRRSHFRPTAVEAGSHQRFCAKSNDPSVSHADSYGRTLNLAPFAAGIGFVDGAKERVIRPIRADDIPASEEIEFVPLGTVMLSRGKTAVDNTAAFTSILRGPTDTTAMLTALC
jgi:hypothetical protein